MHVEREIDSATGCMYATLTGLGWNSICISSHSVCLNYKRNISGCSLVAVPEKPAQNATFPSSHTFYPSSLM